MKRDLDLIRNILIKCEEITPKRIYAEDFVDEFNDFEKISYHLELLDDNGFIECQKFVCLGTTCKDFIIYRLTSSGHDYLDSVRDPKIYDDVKNKMGKLFQTSSLAIIQSLAESIIKSKLGI